MNSHELTTRPEEAVYCSCYTPISLSDLLMDAAERGKIRRLPAAQLFFGIAELTDFELAALMPQITEEQWRGVLDLSLWKRDRTSSTDFLQWCRHILEAEEAVARKLLRGSDPELWQLAFNRLLEIVPCDEKDTLSGAGLGEGDWIATPDGGFWVRLPDEPEASRLIRPLLLKLFALDPVQTTYDLLLSKSRTTSELEETAYQNRRRRIEDLGFQDYFEAISVYSPLALADTQTDKIWQPPLEGGVTVAALDRSGRGLFLLEALSRVEDPARKEELLEELFYVCNKVLSADLVSPDHPSKVKVGIRKTILGISIGLEFAAAGDLNLALQLIQTRYLQSLFQLAFGQLMELQRLGCELSNTLEAPPDSYPSHLVQGLLRKYPLLAVRTSTRIKKRFFRTRSDIDSCRRILESLRQSREGFAP